MKRALLLACTALCACNPVLQPVVERAAQPLSASTRSPRVVWVLDKSGSLDFNFDPSCASGCLTRKQALEQGLRSMSGQLAPARHAAVIYPSGSRCEPATGFAVPLQPAPTTSGFDEVVTTYERTAAMGGTPTAATLDYVGALPDAADADTLVVLVTDGEPNCNPSNPVTCNSPAPCRCTLSSCAGTFCTEGCLDDLATIEASRRLARRGWSLLVMGLGNDTSTLAAALLSGLDIGLPRLCATAGDCRVGGCTSGVCDEKYYQVSSLPDFDRPARRMADAVRDSTSCTWWLDSDVVAGDLAVTLRGVEVPGTDWSLTSPRRLHFSGETCQRFLQDAGLVPDFVWRPGTGG